MDESPHVNGSRRSAGDHVDVLIRTTGERARRDSLERAVGSVLAQQGVAARPIVLVIGRRADRASVTAPAQGATVRALERDATPGQALRAAVHLVEAPYFAFLDDDDELLPHAIATRLDVMRSEPAVGVVVTTGHLVSRDVVRLHIEDIERHQEDPLGGIAEECWLASCGGLYRRSSIASTLFDELPDLCEWTCLAFRLALGGTKVRFVDVATYNVYDTPGSQSKSDAFFDASLQALAMMRASPLPAAVRAKVERRYRAALHQASERFFRAGSVAEAWKLHLKSMKPPHTLRYLAYTRKLLWRGRSQPNEPLTGYGKPNGSVR